MDLKLSRYNNMSSTAATPTSSAQSFGTIRELVERLKKMALHDKPGERKGRGQHPKY